MQSVFKGLCALLPWLLLSALNGAHAVLPGKIYGVNLGSWLVLEHSSPGCFQKSSRRWVDRPVMIAPGALPQSLKWPARIRTLLTKYLTSIGKSTWFTQDDVNKLVSYGINTVRIPLGYWIVEPLVDRSSEFYPRGGMGQLKRGLSQLKAAGISAILDHHALPGVQTPGQQFTGRCTNDVRFYTEENYHRALVWTAVMTALSHLDPDFGSVVAIEAVNEPIMDASQTPGYGDFQKNFVKTVGQVETLLGVRDLASIIPERLHESLLDNTLDATQSFLGGGKRYRGSLGKVLNDAAPILAQIAREYDINTILDGAIPTTAPLMTAHMDINWQYNNPANPADAAQGPQLYDNHLYYSFGGVADANEEAYLASICNLRRVRDDESRGNSPLVFGEWSLATQFNPSDEFLRKWADAQKRAYSSGKGWIFWNFKSEVSGRAGDTPRVWSYFEAVNRGYFTKDPSKLNDPHVCDAFVAGNSTIQSLP